MNLSSLEKRVKELESERISKSSPIRSGWRPIQLKDGRIHPQQQAINAWKAGANEIFYGGAAGGGKTSFAVGQALTEHFQTLILRREGSQLEELISQAVQWAPPGSRCPSIGNGAKLTTPDGRTIRFAGVPNDKDKNKYQGRPKSLLVFDECTEFHEPVVDYISIWLRTTRAGQRTLLLLTGNPPTHTDGAWIIRRYAPWIDPRHPRPAKPGEIRYFVRDAKTEEEIEVKDATPIPFKGELVTPQGRTFIPAKLDDNPMLDPEYASRLMKLPPEMRDAFRYGDFSVSLRDDPWAVIPTSWITAAQARWHANGGDGIPLTTAGNDIAYGGSDRTVLALRHANWIAPFQVWKGEDTSSGKRAAQLVLPFIRGSKAPVNVDIGGCGTAAYEFLKENKVNAHSINFGAGTQQATDRRGVLQFANMRALIYWNLRDMLDPELGDNLALPPEEIAPDLLAELAAPKYEWRAGKVFIRSKEELSAELGRSPDLGDALALACYAPPVVPFFVESW